MNLTEPTIKFLAKTICGENGLLPRKKGPELIDFFSDHGHDDRKRGDFTNRLKFAESKLKLWNNTPVLTKIIEGSLHLREFFASKIDREKTIQAINEQLKKDGYELFKVNDHYKLAFSNGLLVETKNILSHFYIEEQIEICHKHIDDGDYSLGVERAKKLLHSVLTALFKNFDGNNIESEKNVVELYREVRHKLKFNMAERQLPSGTTQLLVGFEAIVEGLSKSGTNASENFADRYQAKFWAGLMVNSSKTITEFLVGYHENMLN